MNSLPGRIKCLDINDIQPEEELGSLLFTDNASTVAILQMCIDKKIRHIVQRSNIDHNKEIQLSQNMDSDPSCYFSFPLSTIFGIENPTAASEGEIRKYYFEVSNASEKNLILENIENYVKGLTKASSLLYEVMNTVDELFTNAIYNAPFVDKANERGGADRVLQNIKIDENKKPSIFAGHDHERIVVGCYDQFGSLNIEKLLSRIKGCYENELSSVINYDSGGAGIGTFMILESSASLYIGVQQGVKTLVCCSFAYKLNSVMRKQIPKNLHIYSG